MSNYQVGDTFYGCEQYTVEYVMKARRFFVDSFYKKEYTPEDIVIVSYAASSGKAYQLVTNGDWEGCEPSMGSLEDALAASLMRTAQIVDRR